MYCKSFLSLPVNCFCPSDSLGFFPFIYLIYNLSMVPTYLSILGDVAPLPSWIYSCVAFCEESIQQFAAPLGIFFSNYSPKLQVNNMDLLVECKWSLYQRISKIPHSDKHYLHQSPFDYIRPCKDSCQCFTLRHEKSESIDTWRILLSSTNASPVLYLVSVSWKAKIIVAVHGTSNPQSFPPFRKSRREITLRLSIMLYLSVASLEPAGGNKAEDKQDNVCQTIHSNTLQMNGAWSSDDTVVVSTDSSWMSNASKQQWGCHLWV